MKEILGQWSGKFKVNGDIVLNLDDVKFKDGEDFHIELLSKQREIDEEDILSAYRL